MEMQEFSKRKLSGAMRCALKVAPRPDDITVYEFYLERNRIKDKMHHFKLSDYKKAMDKAYECLETLKPLLGNPSNWLSFPVIEVTYYDGPVLNTHSMLGCIPCLSSNIALNVHHDGTLEFFQDSKKYKEFMKNSKSSKNSH